MEYLLVSLITLIVFPTSLVFGVNKSEKLYQRFISDTSDFRGFFPILISSILFACLMTAGIITVLF